MSNTWGDRHQDQAICEEFLLKELRRAGEIGVDILQIDDGWECGITSNSKRSSSGVWEGYYNDSQDFWKVNPERFPHGLEAVIQYADGLGIEAGLWFSPDSSNAVSYTHLFILLVIVNSITKKLSSTSLW